MTDGIGKASLAVSHALFAALLASQWSHPMSIPVAGLFAYLLVFYDD